MRAPGPVIVLSTTCSRDPFLSPWRLRCSSSDFLVERSIPNTTSCENVSFSKKYDMVWKGGYLWGNLKWGTIPF